MALSRDLKEFLSLLVEHEVKFMLVGAYAVAVHGYARNTEDIDFWIDRDEANAVRVLNVLSEFGFGDIGFTSADLLDPKAVLQMGRAPNRIDLLTFLTGVDFASCYANRFECEFEGLPIAVIGLDDLLRNKRATARPKDLIDVAEFEKSQKFGMKPDA